MEKNCNDLNEKDIGNITSDFIKVSDNLKIACSKIINKKFSNYPIIIMSKKPVSLGTLFIDNSELMDNSWKYYASYLEILIENKIINEIKEFKKKYKKSNEFCCLLVILNNNSKIIFIPYPED
tara:strand:- start:119 stop:487 length:369 start_codon:yes stop_codon:yes gene_type:complete